MVALVSQMLDLHGGTGRGGRTARSRREAVLQRRIELTDHVIDRLVYELYGLTPEEIKVVEGATNVNG